MITLATEACQQNDWIGVVWFGIAVAGGCFVAWLFMR